MNYHQPRQIDPASDKPDAGKWRYTCMNDGRIWAVGYCSPYRTCPDCNGSAAVTRDWCPTCDRNGFVTVPDPCPGHDTKKGAYEHQTEYVLAEQTRLDGLLSGEQRPCQICEAWTQGLATVGETSFVLCDEHRTSEVVTRLFGTVGDSFGSW